MLYYTILYYTILYYHPRSEGSLQSMHLDLLLLVLHLLQEAIISEHLPMTASAT